MTTFERLKQARIEAGFEDATAAARAKGFNVNTYRSHENGVRGVRPADAERYAKAFHVDPAWLVFGTSRPLADVIPFPSENKTERVQLLMTPSEVKAIDDWSFENRIRGRAEAIRQLCVLGLASGK